MVDRYKVSAKLSSNVELTFVKLLSRRLKFKSPELIKRLYSEEKLSAREIAASLGCGHTSVNYIVKKMNLKKPKAVRRPSYGRSSPNKSAKQFALESRRKNEIQRLAAKGWSLNKIAKDFNVKKYPSPSGRGTWTPKIIKRILNKTIE